MEYLENLDLKTKFNKLKKPQDLMDFMDNYIEYGYININREKCYDLKTFKDDYRINKVDTVLSTGLGICFEQAYLQKYFFDLNKIENRLFVFRIYEKNKEEYENLDDLHVFTLYKDENNWNLFEHARSNKKGIKSYKTIKEALSDSVKNLRDDEIIIFKQLDKIIENVTFKEFNSIVDKLPEYKGEN